jgi:hypothetical protein
VAVLRAKSAPQVIHILLIAYTAVVPRSVRPEKHLHVVIFFSVEEVFPQPAQDSITTSIFQEIKTKYS